MGTSVIYSPMSSTSLAIIRDEEKRVQLLMGGGGVDDAFSPIPFPRITFFGSYTLLPLTCIDKHTAILIVLKYVWLVWYKNELSLIGQVWLQELSYTRMYVRPKFLFLCIYFETINRNSFSDLFTLPSKDKLFPNSYA